jgi:hypothetical protein
MKTVSLFNERGDLRYNQKAILEMAGIRPTKRPMGGFVWHTDENGLVWWKFLGKLDPEIGPYSAREARREAAKIVARARRWLRETAPGFTRRVKLSDWEVFHLYEIAHSGKVDITFHKVGESIEVGRGGTAYFGSGGGWGRWEVFGQISERAVSSRDNGFAVYETVEVTFDHGPAILYTASGDGINGGRLFWKGLLIAQ